MIMEDNTSFYSIEVGVSHLSCAFFLNPRYRHQRTKFELEKNDARVLRVCRRKNIARDNDITSTSRSGLNFVAALELIDSEILWRT